MQANDVDRALVKLRQLGVDELDHIDGSLGQHLKGTYELLRKWGSSDVLCIAGLYHAVYGTDGFPEQLVSVDRRAEIAAIIGEEAEDLAYFIAHAIANIFIRSL